MEIATKREIKYCNASKRIPERNESVDLIYCCHMIEHLDYEETNYFFMECKRILKPGGVITAQVGCLSKKPRQVNNWMKVLSQNFGNSKLDEVVIPSFDCRWNFASSIMNS